MAAPTPTLAALPLKDIHNLLHLTFHRNKNQHHIAKWWKALAVLRRQIGKLVAEVEDAAAGKKGSRARVALRCHFLNERVVPDCFLNFSRVVADNQYSALGLMLLGTLASLQRLLAPFRQKIVKEKEVVVSEASKEVSKSTRPGEKDGEDLGESVSRKVDEDVGEKMVRRRGVEEEGGTKRAFPKAERIKEKEKTSKLAKKKKKKGDAIDDLFSGLL